MTCPTCKETQWSLMDKKYVELFGTCWSEDRVRWEERDLSTADFEEREAQALSNLDT